ncbi:hypothetical protein ASPWEDRAFT_46835 [Aspergillus wentii DTO 134E9]|uniref:Uncharacterized protein n=1 Tax=Aspergillus wentii DTO 134E9 TaxID=1073089 RepID=A0A1L9R407_ASPWE|nr:uncharacterized protein ASPWEDRAFT_46835 [Aspergillus wentii DTO 134E9]OJJ29640.1 hypothetical protein ASPWEDRAFT_46835 [Aspergillus wentii DTO 134E9]
MHLLSPTAPRLKHALNLPPSSDLERTVCHGWRVLALSSLHGPASACRFFRHYPRGDRWWTVTLYDQDALFSDARRDTAAGHSTSVWSFCGGECRTLTKQKRYDVRRLRHFPQYRELRDALDSLLPFRALWKRLRPGTLQRKFALRSPEVSTALVPRRLGTTN